VIGFKEAKVEGVERKKNGCCCCTVSNEKPHIATNKNWF